MCMFYFQKKNIAEIKKCEYSLQQMESSASHLDEISADLKSAVSYITILIFLF